MKYFQSNLPVLLSVSQLFICPVSLNISYHQDFDQNDTRTDGAVQWLQNAAIK